MPNKTIPFCPACVVDFVDRNGADNLRDEIYTMNDPDAQALQEVHFELCSAHTHRNLYAQVAKARLMTKPRYDEIMSIKVEDINRNPSQLRK